MVRNGKSKVRPSRRKDMENKGRNGTLEPIPDTFENVVKALVKPVAPKKPSEKQND